MASPERMRMHEERAARLANLMRDLAQAELEDRERMLVHEGWMRMRMHEERAQSMEARRVESDARVRAIIATLTEMQADIARIDAGS